MIRSEALTASPVEMPNTETPDTMPKNKDDDLAASAKVREQSEYRFVPESALALGVALSVKEMVNGESTMPKIIRYLPKWRTFPAIRFSKNSRSNRIPTCSVRKCSTSWTITGPAENEPKPVRRSTTSSATRQTPTTWCCATPRPAKSILRFWKASRPSRVSCESSVRSSPRFCTIRSEPNP